MGKIRLIIAREYLSRVRKKSWIIMTILGPLLIVGFMTLAAYIGTNDNSKHNVLVSDPASVLALKLRSSENVSFSITKERISDEEFITSGYTDLFHVNENTINTGTVEYVYKKVPSQMFKRGARREIQKSIEYTRMERASIDPEVYGNISRPIKLLEDDVYSDEQDSGLTDKWWVGFSFSIAIYFFIFFYGVQVMRGVIEEKTSRIVEVLVSSVKPFQLMMGKIIGIALVGVTQFALWIILTSTLTGVAASIVPDLNPASIDQTEYSAELIQDAKATQAAQIENASEISILIFEQINWPLMLSCFLFYFVGGYLLYGSLFAAVGSAVDSEADTQQFMMPVTMPLMFGYVIAIFVGMNPEGDAAFWFSMIPFTSPPVMLVRIAMNTAETWEIILSMTLLIGTFIGTTWVAGKIYRTGILMYGKKVSWKELWKWLFY